MNYKDYENQRLTKNGGEGGMLTRAHLVSCRIFRDLHESSMAIGDSMISPISMVSIISTIWFKFQA